MINLSNYFIFKMFFFVFVGLITKMNHLKNHDLLQLVMRFESVKTWCFLLF